MNPSGPPALPGCGPVTHSPIEEAEQRRPLARETCIWATPAVHFDEWAVQMKRQLGLGYGSFAVGPGFYVEKPEGGPR